LDYSGPWRSELKFRILLSLLTGEKKLAGIKADVDARETTILHIIKEFEGLSVTEKAGRIYKLTSVGFIEAQLSKEYYAAMEVIERFKDFWLSHDTTAIPLPLMLRIGALKDATLVKSAASELSKVHETFVQVLSAAKDLKGISPIFHPEYVRILEELLSEGNSVQLILTSPVLTKTLSSVNIGLMKNYMQGGKLKVFINESAKVALTVTQNNFSLGLFKLNGEYDYSEDLVSLSQEAVAWGAEFFHHTLRRSVSIDDKALIEVVKENP
jgi:predicted transcriptional regulator